jgi:hypothetical protein
LLRYLRRRTIRGAAAYRQEHVIDTAHFEWRLPSRELSKRADRIVVPLVMSELVAFCYTNREEA